MEIQNGSGGFNTSFTVTQVYPSSYDGFLCRESKQHNYIMPPLESLMSLQMCSHLALSEDKIPRKMKCSRYLLNLVLIESRVRTVLSLELQSKSVADFI